MKLSALVIDFSRVLIFAHADVPSLNRHHTELATQGNYHVLEHFRVNTELVEFLKTFKTTLPVYLFTDGRLHTLPEIEPQFEGIFTQVVTAESTGYKKYEAAAFAGLGERIGRAPQEILFVDDQARNIAAAKAAGLQTHQYSSNAELEAFLKNTKT